MKLTNVLYGYYNVKMLGLLDKYIIETLFCISLSYLFFYGLENVLIKKGQMICKIIDEKFRINNLENSV